MKWTIIADSCCDLRDEDLTGGSITFKTIPLTLTLGEEDFIDDQTLDTALFIPKMKASKTLRSACPSPEAFMEHMRDNDNIIIVTLSSKLSGTHGSALIAVEQIKSEFPNKKVYLLDSLSASAGMASLCVKIKELIENGNMSFEELTEKLDPIRSKTRVRFLLQDLSNLVKTGRLSKVMGGILGLTPLKLICGDDGNGEIKKFGSSLGTKKGLVKLSEFPPKDASVVIAHAHNETDAGYLKGLLEKLGITNIKTVLMRGVATFYSNDKGIVLAY
ncbi:MAG: DegV family protein [Firmicutes bacterium]|nr:DegV family protein [Bacillota bacterium]